MTPWKRFVAAGTDSFEHDEADALIGRDTDLQRIRSLLGVGGGGGALLLSGEAGVGKTAVLHALAEAAAADGARVLRAVGVEFEADCSYSGLNQVLFPFQEVLADLEAGYRDALRVALGFESGSPPEKLVVSEAVLVLLQTLATEEPLLVIVDDLPWIDRASAAVLGFVARRATGVPVSFLAASRPGSHSLYEGGALPTYQLRPLNGEAAAHLVGTRFPGLAGSVRQRLVSAAGGNPLALLELPRALRTTQSPALDGVPVLRPPGRRPDVLFGSRVAGLPRPSQRLLLLAALEGSGDLDVLQAASRQADDGYGLDDLAPAERQQLVQVDRSTRRLRFRHPLIRSAVVERSTSGERRAVHGALAQVLVDQPERQAWHLGEAAVEPDEVVAALLEQAARLTMRRGDANGSMRTLIRSAALTPQGPDRGRRLAEAAYIGAESSGTLPSVQRLLDDARRVAPDLNRSLHSAAAAALLILNSDGDVDTAHRLLVGAVETGAHGYDAHDTALIDALHILALVCFFGARHELWKPFYHALERLTPKPPPFLSALGKTFSDPAHTGIAASRELDGLLAELTEETDPVQINRTGTAALYLDRLSEVREAEWRVVRMGREGGPARWYLSGLTHLCLDDYLTGMWDEALGLADEGLQVCEDHGYRAFAWHFLYIQAIVRAARGEADGSQAMAGRIIHWALPRGAHCAAHYARHAATLEALGRCDFSSAYRHANAISPAGTLASHVPHALWVTMDLVEAAVRTNRHTEAAAHVHAMREAGTADLSLRHALLTQASAAWCATDDDEALRLFAQALAVPGADRWLFDFARVQLAYGERLRRARATAESRGPLSAALATFEHLQARPWAERAEKELRAAGSSKRHSGTSRERTLTSQEREIAQLAARGLTNKQIAERLFLSHRTVGAHLYQIYPKLGITSRGMLRDALGPQSPLEIQQ
ncbi:LuxR family transcriptional regulator OS=Streptomyces aurantiogriseus OX=66870 GN=GCM10010251_22170 PE=4 SV=1 [Streptomyces aurantiogriseus]|uniref:LuxR family transcriptional regulator n=2 Tax=Streptomyces aurantiogriseus TaxID=66870 RepID=A0A918F6J2_9ACTN|nr:LuxR family transcriptional regulator [Streptomyces aurantiogriseus]